MERLTYMHDGTWCINGVNGKLTGDSQANYWGEAVEQLARYEETGYTPEDFDRLCREMCKMRLAFGIKTFEELRDDFISGRLVMLPCKVGDTVYIPNITNCSRKAVAVRVQGISISVSGRTILRFGGYPFESAWGDGCGKDWFLTREEAEEAMRKEETE